MVYYSLFVHYNIANLCGKYYPFNDIAFEWYYMAIIYLLYSIYRTYVSALTVSEYYLLRNQMCIGMRWNELNWKGGYMWACVMCVCVDCTDFTERIYSNGCIFYALILLLSLFLYSVLYVCYLIACNGNTIELFPLCTYECHTHTHAHMHIRSSQRQSNPSIHMYERCVHFTQIHAHCSFKHTYSHTNTHGRTDGRTHTHKNIQWSIVVAFLNVFPRSVLSVKIIVKTAQNPKLSL